MKLVNSIVVLFLSLSILAGLAGCTNLSSPSASPTPALALTEISRARETLRAQVVAVAPTVTSFSQVEQTTGTPAPNASPSVPLITTDSVALEATSTPILQAPAGGTEAPNQDSSTPFGQPVVRATPRFIPPVTGLTLASPTAVARPEQVLFQDDFSRELGWYTTDSERYRLAFDQGAYRISVMTKNNPVWSIRKTPFADSRVEVDAVQLRGPADGYYGLVCRHVDADHYYLLVVSRDGSFGIGKVDGQEIRYLAGTNQYNDQVRSGGNRLRADCVGDTLALYVDGQKVLETVDDGYKSGATGVVVGNRTTSGTDVLFDNYIVLKP